MANLQKFGNASSMRSAGKCGVSAAAVAELLQAIASNSTRAGSVPAGSAVYICGQRDGLEPLARAGFRVWTQRDVLPAAELRRWAGHASFFALLDAAISTRARVFVAARGNFDRTVTARRALRGRSTLDSHDIYFAARKAKGARCSQAHSLFLQLFI